MQPKFIKILFPFILLMIAMSSINAQSIKAYIKAADNSYKSGDFFTAYVYYRKVLDVDPERTDIYFKYAESARMFQTYRVAESAYRNITEGKDADNYPLALYWLARMRKNLGDHSGAKALFEKYLDKFKRHNSRFAFRAEKDIADCEWAMRNIRPNNTTVKVEAVDGGVNSPYSEFGAFELDDELFFTSMRFKDEKNENRLYSKLMVKNKGGSLETIDWGNNESFTANAAINFNETKIFYTLCGFQNSGSINCRIVYKEKDFYGGWGEQKELPTHINFPGRTSTHPTIGYDQINEKEILIFASNRPGGKGKLDLWYSYIDQDGKFTRPINLSEFNTRENEVTPFFHSPSQSLYYSSDGYQGMGGYDIYKVKKMDHFWNKPTHMGFPINSSYNDFYFTLNKEGSKTYFASNRAEALDIDPESEACCNDIFTASIRPDRVIFNPEDVKVEENPLAEYPTVEVEIAEPPVESQTPETETVTEQGPNEVIGSQPRSIEGNADSKEEIATNEVPPANTNTSPSNSTKPETTTDPNDIPESILGNRSTEIIGNEIIVSNPEIRSNKGYSNFDYDKLPSSLYPLKFKVMTYDMDDIPLKKAKIEFIEIINGRSGIKFVSEKFSDNNFIFKLKHGVDYQLVLSSPGYFSDTLLIEKEMMDGITDQSQKFYMMLNEGEEEIPESPIQIESEDPLVSGFVMNQMLPISLYFDDDRPDEGSLSTTTTKPFEQTYIFYFNKKEKYKKQYSQTFAPSQQSTAADDIEYFFENEVKYNFEQLKDFSTILLQFLQNGNSVEIQIQPFEDDSMNPYKIALMQRRVSAVENHFKTYLNGQFLPYFETGILRFTILPPIQNTTSSNTNSKFSPEISRTRRVEIKALRFN